jgi:hypothetical protein
VELLQQDSKVGDEEGELRSQPFEEAAVTDGRSFAVYLDSIVLLRLSE